MAHTSALTIVALLLSSAAVLTSGWRNCWVKRYGKLKMFNGERGNLELPCKYRLADLTCGGYRIQVTGGNALDGLKQNRFSPDTVWVHLTNTLDGSEWVGRSAARLLKEATEDSAVWMERVGDLQLDVKGYDVESQAALLAMKDVFQVSFSTGRDNAGIMVSCHSEDFESTPYPDTLCGKGTRTKVLHERRLQLFGEGSDNNDETRAQVLSHDVLTNLKVKQSKSCDKIAKVFQHCGPASAEAARTCGPIFGSRSLSKCLLKTVEDVSYFNDCVTSVCIPNALTSCYGLRSTIEARCKEELASIPGLRC